LTHDQSAPDSVQLSPANLEYAETIQTEMIRICLTYADLSDVDLSGADLSRTTMLDGQFMIER
jgi:uncharacterized protein YjbI with pentapeptide repeats